MKTYRFKTAEIEEMKRSILDECDSEKFPDKNGNLSAWKLRLYLKAIANSANITKRERERRYRRIALYESLTRNDMPAWV